jgi:hypothetical protein
MGILKRIGKAISVGLEALEEQVASPTPISSAPVEPDPAEAAHRIDAWESRRAEVAEKKPEAAPTTELAFYERRSREYFALIRKMEAQREEWKLLYQRDSQGHQEAQAILQEHIINLRMQVVSLVRQLNAFRQEKGEPPIDLTKLDLRAPPVGIAEETAARNAHDRASVMPQTSVEEALVAIHAAVPVPDGVVLAEGEAPKIS